jgi:large subunit ribosomal protein L19
MVKSSVKISPVNMKERAALGLRAGDTVRVWQNIVELKQGKAANKKEVVTKNMRKQAFEGLILAVKHGTEAGAMFTVRKVSSGVGVEKIFPLYSPMIDSVEVLRRTRTRRAKLYFIRRKASSEVKRAMRRQQMVPKMVAAADEEAPAEVEQIVVDGAPVDVSPEVANTELAGK